MKNLPDEIWAEVLDYLEHQDIVSAQRISPSLLKLARDNTLWRYKCFEKSPCASIPGAHSNLAALTGALGGLSLSDHAPTQETQTDGLTASGASEPRSRISKRAQAVADWDFSHPSEKIDWYSEFIARNASLSTQWLDNGKAASEIRGVAAFSDSTKAVGPLDDGSLCVWDIAESSCGRRRFWKLGRTAPSALFEARTLSDSPSGTRKNLSFSGVSECVNVDSARAKAFVAVDRYLNEVDINTMQVVSRHTYAWPITAVSQEGSVDLPLTVGTTWSLNLYDARAQMRDRSRSPEDLLRSNPADPEDSIAFLPNYMKAAKVGAIARRLPPPTFTHAQPTQSQVPSTHPNSLLGAPVLGSALRFRRRNTSDCARIEPGPLSILHQGTNEILIAGRFPSILSYDRRYFPRLQYAIHSGARLSNITSSPYPPGGTSVNSGADATLIACGEYGGRGSLELYSMPHSRQETSRKSEDYGLADTAGDLTAADREHAMFREFSEPEYPFCYKNRHSASSSKLLSVAVQGTRIVFSDAEGGLKWFERDGRGLVRKWNINPYEINGNQASVQGEQVVRKIVPLAAAQSERGIRGDGDLLVWTGERLGIVTTTPWRDGEELAKTFDEKLKLDDGEEVEAYNLAMRRALERQHDEMTFMRRMGFR